MEKENKEQNYSAGGFRFSNSEDASRAKIEERKIQLIEKRTDYQNPKIVLGIYNKAIQERTFQTPIGYAYMQKLREFLLQSPEIQAQVQEIPLYSVFHNSIREKPMVVQTRLKMKERKKEEERERILQLRNRFRFSMLLNVLLMLMVIAMFIITIESDNPNILNYKYALENQYAEWSAELTERENVIREKEKELSIQE